MGGASRKICSTISAPEIQKKPILRVCFPHKIYPYHTPFMYVLTVVHPHPNWRVCISLSITYGQICWYVLPTLISHAQGVNYMHALELESMREQPFGHLFHTPETILDPFCVHTNTHNFCKNKYPLHTEFGALMVLHIFQEPPPRECLNII